MRPSPHPLDGPALEFVFHARNLHRRNAGQYDVRTRVENLYRKNLRRHFRILRIYVASELKDRNAGKARCIAPNRKLDKALGHGWQKAADFAQVAVCAVIACDLFEYLNVDDAGNNQIAVAQPFYVARNYEVCTSIQPTMMSESVYPVIWNPVPQVWR